MAKVIKKGNAPSLIVTDEYRDVERVMIVYDGSDPAARTLNGFIHLMPCGKDVDIEMIIVSENNSMEEMDRVSTILSQAETYLKEH